MVRRPEVRDGPEVGACASGIMETRTGCLPWCPGAALKWIPASGIMETPTPSSAWTRRMPPKWMAAWGSWKHRSGQNPPHHGHHPEGATRFGEHGNSGVDLPPAKGSGIPRRPLVSGIMETTKARSPGSLESGDVSEAGDYFRVMERRQCWERHGTAA